METENVSDRSSSISVSIGLQNVMDRYGTDQKAIRYNGNIVLNVTIGKKWRCQNFGFLILKYLSPGQFLGSSNSHRYNWILKLLVAT